MKKHHLVLCVSLLCFLPLLVNAGPSGPYHVVVEGDGIIRVKRAGSPDGYGYVGGVYATEGDARRAANRANRQQKKLDKDKGVMDDGNCPSGVLC